ncbi:hypothetical protein [Rhodoferax bucti]|uniref:hypothetical protein n=1 Tax=Rhodoferax bucti TaxID=2576305 RepID=UPI00110988AD|nr:hypothetical protein [Rhodoferax bucti]
MPHRLFNPHGSALVERAPGLLIAHMHGDWNAEMRSLIAEQMKAHVPALNAAGPWCIINHMHDTLVYGPDIYAQTRADYASRPAGSLLRAVAFVIAPHVEGASLLRSRFETLLDGIITSRVFADAGSARAWAQAQLLGPPAEAQDAGN